jgi:hypothetical protein
MKPFLLGLLVSIAVLLVPNSSLASKRYLQSVRRALACIHSHEGSWSDPNAPYWGGFQMDISFMQTYGEVWFRKWGTADHWAPWAQRYAARRAVRARGYTPWPNTRRMCGV